MKNIIAAALLLIALPATVTAHKFQTVLNEIVQSNPELKALAASHGAEIEQMAQENVLAGPEIEGNHKWGTRHETKYGVGITQRFDWPGSYRARSKARTAAEKAMLQLQLSTVLDKTVEAKLLMIQYVTTGEKLKLMLDAKGNMDRLLTLYERGFKAGEESILDVNKLKIEQLRMARDVAQLEDTRDNVLQMLLSMAGGAPVAAGLKELTVADIPQEPVGSEEYYEGLIDQSPAMAYYRSMDESMVQNKRVARMAGMPSFAVGYELEREDGQYFNGISVSIEMPSWSNKHRKASAEYARLENELNMNSARLASVMKMRSLRASALRAQSQCQQFASVLGELNQQELLMKALKGGQISLLQYLQEMDYFLEASADYLETLNNAAQLSAELNKYNLQ